MSSLSGAPFGLFGYAGMSQYAGGRITCCPGLSPTGDSVSTGSNLVSYVPHISSTIPIYDGKSWRVSFFNTVSVYVGGLSEGVYDVYVGCPFLGNGSVGMSLVAWGGATPPSTRTLEPISRLYYNNAGNTVAPFGLFVGCVFVQGGTVRDYPGARCIINYYNRE